MTRWFNYALAVGLAMTALFWNGEIVPTAENGLTSSARALVGAPVTPLSYAGVARRTTARAVTPGVGYGGVGGPASGVGVLPGVGAGLPGAGVGGVANHPGNRGGPVNRVGRR